MKGIMDVTHLPDRDISLNFKLVSDIKKII